MKLFSKDKQKMFIEINDLLYLARINRVLPNEILEEIETGVNIYETPSGEKYLEFSYLPFLAEDRNIIDYEKYKNENVLDLCGISQVMKKEIEEVIRKYKRDANFSSYIYYEELMHYRGQIKNLIAIKEGNKDDILPLTKTNNEYRFVFEDKTYTYGCDYPKKLTK